jgi:hypothetical protein
VAQGFTALALPSPDEQTLKKGAQNMTVWDFLEEEANNAEGVRALADWSASNQDVRTGTTFGVFLDLIGWSSENLGQALVSEPSSVIGYVEADLLADALKDWSNRPLDVEAWVDKFLAVEMEEV